MCTVLTFINYCQKINNTGQVNTCIYVDKKQLLGFERKLDANETVNSSCC